MCDVITLKVCSVYAALSLFLSDTCERLKFSTFYLFDSPFIHLVRDFSLNSFSFFFLCLVIFEYALGMIERIHSKRVFKRWLKCLKLVTM